jgi:hypothetical protein
MEKAAAKSKKRKAKRIDTIVKGRGKSRKKFEKLRVRMGKPGHYTYH